MQEEFTAEKPWGGYKDLSKMLNIPVSKLRDMVYRRQIPHIKLSPNCPRFYLYDGENELSIHRWLEKKYVMPISKSNPEP